MVENVEETALSENELIVESLNDFLRYISNMRKRIKDEEGEDTDTQQFFFRGQPNCEWDIAPSLFRNNLLAFESELIQSAYLRNPVEFQKMGSDFERLAKLQHYGLPTRLLDVTKNPLVALYFACHPHEEKELDDEGNIKAFRPTDGAVFFKRTYAKGYDEQEISAICHICSIDINGEVTLDDILYELEASNIYTKSAAEECRKSNYGSLIRTLQSGNFVISNMNNERLIRQSGSFLVAGKFNININEASYGNSLVQKAKDSFRGEFDLQYFRIPAEKKQDILEELDFCNINEGSLFPELEHQLSYIKEMQSTKTARTLGQFVKIESEKKEVDFQTLDIGQPISNEKAEQATRAVLKKHIDSGLVADCFATIKPEMVIDWSAKESAVSRIRLNLAKMLEKTPQYTRETAKEKSQQIVSEILAELCKE